MSLVELKPQASELKQLECGRFHLTIPDNGISPTGVDEIQRFLYFKYYCYIPDSWNDDTGRHDWKWTWKVNGKGEYVGTLPKRISKYFYQCHRKKLLASELSEIGNIASQHSLRDCEFWFDIVQDIDWDAGDFGDEGSCFWGDHADAKDMLMAANAFAIRFFANSKFSDILHNGYARAWIIEHEGVYLVFNGYGLETLPIARILATHLDHAYYRTIELTNSDSDEGTLWINGGKAYAVGLQETVITLSHVDLEIEEPFHQTCDHCSEHTGEDNIYTSPDGNETFCERCYSELFASCHCCKESCYCNSMISSPDGDLTCESCHEKETAMCAVCSESVWKKDIYEAAESTSYSHNVCTTCLEKDYSECEECGKHWQTERMTDKICWQCREEREESDDV